MTTQDATADWQRLQQAFLEQWLGVDPGFAADPWSKLKAMFTAPESAAGPAGSPPWQAFGAFAELLRAQADGLKTGRRRRVDVATAMQALLENLVRGLDAALATQALATRDDRGSALAFGHAFVSWPALGLGREWQSRLQRCWHAWLLDQEADGRLRTLQWRALREGCEHCRRALAANGPAITSVRGLYDLFVDALETAWREAVMGDDYARAFGERVNAGLRLRLALRDCMQSLATPLELAGRAELDALERRLRALEEHKAVGVEAASPSRPAPEPAAPPVEPPAPKARATRRPAARAAGEVSASRRVPRRKPARKRADFDISTVIGGDEQGN